MPRSSIYCFSPVRSLLEWATRVRRLQTSHSIRASTCGLPKENLPCLTGIEFWQGIKIARVARRFHPLLSEQCRLVRHCLTPATAAFPHRESVVRSLEWTSPSLRRSNQRPLALAADVAVRSVTKFVGGQIQNAREPEKCTIILRLRRTAPNHGTSRARITVAAYGRRDPIQTRSRSAFCTASAGIASGLVPIHRFKASQETLLNAALEYQPRRLRR